MESAGVERELDGMKKRYRIYFNRKEDAPQVWSVDEGSHASEINVKGVRIVGAVVHTGQNLEAEYPEPKAWMEVEAVLAIGDGTVELYA